jgi:hypothetical protein
METVQVMGGSLDSLLQHIGIRASKLVETKDGWYQVWELSSNDFSRLEDFSNRVDENAWKRSNFGWWRIAESCFTGNETITYKVNGHEMLGYIRDFRYDFDGANDDDSVSNEVIVEIDQSINYATFIEWLSEIMNLSNETNTVAVATSLAKENGLTLAEFIARYQGKREEVSR